MTRRRLRTLQSCIRHVTDKYDHNCGILCYEGVYTGYLCCFVFMCLFVSHKLVDGGGGFLFCQDLISRSASKYDDEPVRNELDASTPFILFVLALAPLTHYLIGTF